MRFKLFASFAVAAVALAFQIVPSYAQIQTHIDDPRKRHHQGQPQGMRPQPQPPQVHQPRPQPQPHYVPRPQPQPQYHHPRPRHDGPRWGGGVQIVPVPQYIDRPVYIQPEPQYYQQPRYYEEEPQYRPRRAVRSRQICRTVWARDDYGRRYKVKRCRPRR